MSPRICHLTVSTIVFNERLDTLLIFHNKLNLWLYPGGHLEANEDPAEGALREVLEETGVRATLLPERLPQYRKVIVHHAPWGILKMPVDDKQAGPHNHIDLVYVARSEQTTVIAKASEVSQAMWADSTLLHKLPTPVGFAPMVDDAAGWAKLNCPTIDE
ncbi:NUDIX hydrolase [Natronoglycomyces albus]|uniref:NUDIX domain-containing protein n=1 Tax=Natronoglycomyces albus TaxID=2811108 RepID=A0A895XFG3_9ACTN|nr:NUDIX domain-containing protein [Natronoglycomyces albus]QSB04064.1 NUDIX domain-containing protein [Natronoglycomyces albus]